MLFSRNPIRKPTRFTLAGTRISLFRLQNHTFSLFHTCTAFWLQQFITNSQNGVQRSHFGFQSGHRRARPARPAGSEVVPDEPGRLARPARPPGPRLAGRWAASREGNEGRAQEGGSAQERRAPPHSYHRRWVIWYSPTRAVNSGRLSK